MDNDDSSFEISIDPYDLLQEHDLLIQRLIKAHNETEKRITQLAQNQTSLNELLMKLLKERPHR